jgi:hypothetical protein
MVEVDRRRGTTGCNGGPRRGSAMPRVTMSHTISPPMSEIWVRSSTAKPSWINPAIVSFTFVRQKGNPTKTVPKNLDYDKKHWGAGTKVPTPLWEFVER